jgi:DNA repair exonuclease SbcCD nuclease subunit
MRILHLADFHLKLTGPRAEECRRILTWIPEHAREVKPDAIVIAGDVYDRQSTPKERIYLMARGASILSALADVAPVFAINGNHDDPEDLRLFHQWRPEIEIITEPTLRPLKGKTLAFLPWPSLGHLAAAIGPQASIAERREIAKAALIDVLRGFKSPTLLVAHIPVTGASMDSGQPVSGGEEIALSAHELLECGAAGVALGHIHLRQQMRTGCQPVWYAGAPFRNSFGEASGEKGGLLWDWIGGAWYITPWDVPARPMVLVSTRYESGNLVSEDPPGEGFQSVCNAEIRLRVSFQPEERDIARVAIESAKASYLSSEAYSVTVEERPVIITRSRCAEIEKARTPADKLAAWAHTTDQEIPEGAGLKLATLEAEARP